MVETPALISSPPVHKGFATAALVLGVVGIFVPFAGVILGALAIVFGIIALRKKTTSVAPAIIGIVTGGVAILATALIISLLAFLATGASLFAPSDRDRAVTAMINEKKDFRIGETAKVGWVDVKITDVERNHVLTADEKQPAYKNPAEANPDESLSKYRRGPGEDIPEADAEYVVVKGQTSPNQSPSGVIEDGRFGILDWRLNRVGVYYKIPAAKGASDFTLIYRIRKGADTLVLKGDITIFTSVSPIVGTEGAPRKTLTYSITLN